MSEYDLKIDKKQTIPQNYNNTFFNNTSLGKLLGSIFGNIQQVKSDSDIGLDVVQISGSNNEEAKDKKTAQLKPEVPLTPYNELGRFISLKRADRYKTQNINGKIIEYTSLGEKFSESVKLDNQNQNLTETTFFDSEGYVTCKVVIAEGDVLESAEFYDKEGKVISSTNKDGETTSENNSNLKIFFDTKRMCISSLREIDPNTGNVCREINDNTHDVSITEYDIQTGEELSSYSRNEITQNDVLPISYNYDTKSGKGYIYHGDKLKETIEYDSNGNVIKRIRGSIVREYDPNTGKEIKRTDIDGDEDYSYKKLSEYNTVTGKKIKYAEYENEELLFTKEYMYDSVTGNKIKEIHYDSDGSIGKEIEYNPGTGHVIKSSEYNSDGSRDWYEYDVNGFAIRGETYNPDGILKSRTDCELDSETGQVKRVMYYDSNNNMTSYMTYEYNNETGVIKRKFFRFDNSLNSELEFDSVTHKRIKSIEYADDGTISKLQEWDRKTGAAQKETTFNPDGSISKIIEFIPSKNLVNNEPFYSPKVTEYNPDGSIKSKKDYAAVNNADFFIFDYKLPIHTTEYNSDGSIKNEQFFGCWVNKSFQSAQTYDASNTPAADLMPKTERTVIDEHSFKETLNGVNYEVKYENNQLKVKRENEKEEMIDTSDFCQAFVIDVLMRVNPHALYELAKEKTVIKWSSDLRPEHVGVYVKSSNTTLINRNHPIDPLNTDEIVQIINHECGHLFDSVDDKEIATKAFENLIKNNPAGNVEGLSIEELLEKHGTRQFKSDIDSKLISTINKEFNNAFPVKNPDNKGLSIKERTKKEYLQDYDNDMLYALTSTSEFFAEAYSLLTSGNCMSASLLCNYFPESLKLVKEIIEKEESPSE